MKFISLSKTTVIPDHMNDNKEILKEEFRVAPRAGEGRLGKAHFFYRYFINVKYVSWQDIRRAYLRVESGESGEFLLRESYLMLCFADGGEAKLRFEREENIKCVLDYLTEHYPQAEVGYKKTRGLS